MLIIKESCNLIWWKAQLAIPNQNTFSTWLSPCKLYTRSIDSFQKYWWSKNPVIRLEKRYNWPPPTKSFSLKCDHPFMTNFMKKAKILLGSFQRYWWSNIDYKNPWDIWILLLGFCLLHLTKEKLSKTKSWHQIIRNNKFCWWSENHSAFTLHN